MNTTVDRTGVFRVISTEHGLGQTRKAGLPQYNIQTTVTAFYDEESETWVDFTASEMEIGVRQCLFGKDKKTQEVIATLSYDNVCKVFGWDGADLQVLAELPPGVKFQVTLKDNDPEFADKNPYQVDWIDEFDADPSQKITKCSKAEITALNAKYAALLKAKATPAAPATPAAAKAAAKPKAGKKGTVIKKGKAAPKAPPKTPAVPVTPAAVIPPAPVPAAPVAGAQLETTQVKNYTKAQAWQVCAVDLRNSDCDDEALGIAWQAAIHAESGGKGEVELTGEGWWNVKEKVLTEVGAL